MTIQKLGAINPAISNISWYRGEAPRFTPQAQHTSNYVVQGNPNKPVTVNADKNAGALKGLGVYYLA